MFLLVLLGLAILVVEGRIGAAMLVPLWGLYFLVNSELETKCICGKHTMLYLEMLESAGFTCSVSGMEQDLGSNLSSSIPPIQLINPPPRLNSALLHTFLYGRPYQLTSTEPIHIPQPCAIDCHPR